MILIEFDTKINKPIEEVFDKLTDIQGYNHWMSKSGLFIHSKKTTEGPEGEGTKFVDKVKRGKAMGKIVDYKKPTLVNFQQTVYYRGIKLMESCPGYELESINGQTNIHHRAEGKLYGIFKIFEPIITVIARKERIRTVNALKMSFK